MPETRVLVYIFPADNIYALTVTCFQAETYRPEKNNVKRPFVVIPYNLF